MVSNPLRLEGDREAVADVVLKVFVSNPLRLEGDFGKSRGVISTIPFLIHYGWRGTLTWRVAAVILGIVSNPLRVEGDGQHRFSDDNRTAVSNPLRVEGDQHTGAGTARGLVFLIHYGWRETEMYP